jgi:hypothetical protein
MQPLQDYRVPFQLPADGGKILNRLYAIVSQAGFNIGCPAHHRTNRRIPSWRNYFGSAWKGPKQ